MALSNLSSALGSVAGPPPCYTSQQPSPSPSFSAETDDSSSSRSVTPDQLARANIVENSCVHGYTHTHSQCTSPMDSRSTAYHSTSSATIPARVRHHSFPYGNYAPFPQHHLYYTPPTGVSTSTLELADYGPLRSADRPPTAVPPEPEAKQSNVSAAAVITRRAGVTNYVSLSRKSTPRRAFHFRSRASASVKGTFTIDPRLEIPPGLLNVLSASGDSSSILDTSGNHGSDITRKNLRIEVENGGIDVDVYLIARESIEPPKGYEKPSTLELKVQSPKSRKAFPLVARIHAPTPRAPIHLNLSSVSIVTSSPSVSSTVEPRLKNTSTSPLTLSLPLSFYGPLTLTIASGNLDSHLSLSRGFITAAVVLNETATKRGYFVGALDGKGKVTEVDITEHLNQPILNPSLNRCPECGSARADEGISKHGRSNSHETLEAEEWAGDRVDISVGAGRVRLQFVGEKEGWFSKLGSSV
ncbi:hypothetical protein BDQ12DRAFT_678447 [Crucibulum laeve]|uniref:DUF7330 domain-containing protein n=1 Tax=Crucibulum laeve TaxID=68775 RepID=A0A5C3M8Y6_9AGAR|nr:hypothetical protein BDQ12DRAFT_678447 [Crucibulum laeve]